MQITTQRYYLSSYFPPRLAAWPFPAQRIARQIDLGRRDSMEGGAKGKKNIEVRSRAEVSK